MDTALLQFVGVGLAAGIGGGLACALGYGRGFAAGVKLAPRFADILSGTEPLVCRATLADVHAKALCHLPTRVVTFGRIELPTFFTGQPLLGRQAGGDAVDRAS